MKHFIKSTVCILGIAVLAACSVEVDGGGDGGSPGTIPAQKGSPETQVLKLQSIGGQEYNNIDLVSPANGALYFFTYTPAADGDITLQWGQMVGLNCPTTGVHDLFAIEKLNASGVVIGSQALGVNSAFRLTKGQAYRVKVMFSGFSSCKHLNYTFYAQFSEVHEVALPEKALSLSSYNSIYVSSAQTSQGDVVQDFGLTPATDKAMYIESWSEGVVTGCAAKKLIQWIVLDSSGAVASTSTITSSSDIYAKAGVKNILRVRYSNTTGCGSISASFTLRSL